MAWGRVTDVSDDVEAHMVEASEGTATLDALERLPDKPEQGEWVDTGIQDVPTADLPRPAGVEGPEDFHKVSAEEMRAGLERLQEMRPAIQDGPGNSSDYWADFDAQRGLDYADGYRRVYDAFYGQDAIRLAQDGSSYDIINGRHRIALAQEMGISTLPARVVARQRA